MNLIESILQFGDVSARELLLLIHFLQIALGNLAYDGQARAIRVHGVADREPSSILRLNAIYVTDRNGALRFALWIANV